MNRTLLTAIMMLLCSFSFLAAESIVEFDFLIAQNDSVALYNARTLLGTPDQKTNDSDYQLHIYGENKNLLVETNLPVYFVLLDPMEEVFETYTSVQLPYSRHYTTVGILHDKNEIYKQDISFLCNEDQICERNENYVSCPADCPSGGQDGLCDRKSDGRCDSDCSKGDEDCKMNWTDNNLDKRKNNIIFGLIILCAGTVLFILHLISKTKKN